MNGALAVLISKPRWRSHAAAQRLEAARPLDQPEIDWNAIDREPNGARVEILCQVV